ncbi:hypothetical protein A6A40_17335 (plasmid) [Azospirillum humicireducens]|uniref:Tape measure protein N-terminal domain-containing protein n=1 Tax=Azospirillum humicireducens TaxID=1226968 RepID=A0A2R4VQW7_9PROT|nr:tape measure protein [Azospirillum humicireducens]AWB06815.1 hypothetical protein A6A40_17335 [Azospirillum humicireducens]
MTIALFPFVVCNLSSSSMKVAFQFVADASGLVGGIRVARDELDRLGKTTADAAEGMRSSTGTAVEASKGVARELSRVSKAANEAGESLDRAVGGNTVSGINRQRQATKGLADDMGAVGARANALQQAVNGTGSAHASAASATGKHSEAIKGFNRDLEGANDNTLTLSGALSGLRGAFSLLGSLAGGEMLRRFAVQAIETRKEIELLDIRLRSLTGSTADYGETQTFLSGAANRLSADQLTLTQTYAQLLELKRADLVTTGQARTLLEGFVNIQKATGASTDELKLSLVGMAQGFSAGVLHAEELAQVTEPLPGLMQALDRASGNTAGGFRRLVNDGRVTSSMFRDVLIKALQEYAGAAEKAANTIAAAETRRDNALRRLKNESGRQLAGAWNDANDIIADGANWAASYLQGNSRSLDINRLTALYKNRQYATYQLERATSPDDATKYSERLDRLNRQIAAVEQRLSELGATAEDTHRGMSEIWKEIDIGTKVTGDQIAAFTAAAQAAGLNYDKGKLLTTGQAQLGQAVKAVNELLAKSPSALKEIGLDASTLTMVLDKLKEKLDPVTAAIADLNREATTVAILPKYRDLYTLFDKATEEKGRPLDVNESADLTAAWRKKRNADSAEQVRLANEAAAAATRLAQAQDSGRPATVAAARADLQVAEALRDGVIVQADKASYHAAKLKENMAGLAGQAGEAATASSRQARQALELAAATEQGGAAAAAAALRHQIENETLKVGAGAHGELARRLTEEDAARRKLAGAQWNRDMDLQIQAAKSLAEAEGRGAKAVAEATTANQVAAQVEKEGVEVDGARAKAIGAKTAELLKWQERQNYQRSLREADDDIALLQRELALQGEGETIRSRTLELARAELDIRHQFPTATEAEVAALLRKHETAIRLREDIAQQRGLWDELGRLGERAFDRIGSAITEAFTQGKSSTISWGSVAKAVMSEVIQAAMQLAVVNPLKNWATGSNAPSLWSSSGQDAQAGGTAGAGGITLGSGGSSPFSLGGLVSKASGGWLDRQLGGGISSAASWLNTPVYGMSEVLNTGQVAQQAAQLGTGARELASNSMPLAGSPGSGGVTPGDMLSGVGYGINAFMNFKSGNVVGGIGNTAATVMSFIPGLQEFAPFVALGSQLLGGLFGKNRGEPAAAAVVGYNGTKQSYAGSATDNEGSAEQAQQLLQSLDAATSKFLALVGGKTTGEFGIGVEAKEGRFRVREGGAAGQLAGDYATLDEAVIAGFRYNVSKGLISASDDVLKAVKNSTKTDINEFLADVSFAKDFRSQFDAMNLSLDPTSNQIRSFTEQAKTLGDQIATNIVDWRTKASELGLATETELTSAARKGMQAMLGLGATTDPLTGLAAVTKQAEINVETFRPALATLGYTAAEQADIVSRYTQKLKDDYTASVQLVQRQGAAAIGGLTDPSAIASMSDRFRTALGLDPTIKGVAGLVTTLQAVEASAVRGALTMGDLRAALAQLDTALMDGVVTGEQYTSLIATLTSAWSNAQGVMSALRQGQIAVEQAIDAGWRPTLDARLSDAGLSGAAIEALRPTWQAVIDGATNGAVSAGQMRTALAALDSQLKTGTITADQHKSAVAVLTAAWQDSTTAATQAAEAATQAAEAATQAAAARAEQVASTWSSLLSTAVQQVGEKWRTVASDAQQAASAWSNVADAMSRASRDVMLDTSTSNLGSKGLRDAAKEEFERLQKVIATYADAQKEGKATDAQRTAALDAAGQLDAIGKKYLEAQRAYSGDGSAYDQTLTDVRAAWDSTGALGLTLKSAETKRAEDAQTTIDRLERLTGIGSDQRALLDQIKAAIGTGNTDMAQLVGLVRNLPGYQRYAAPADVQATWNGLSTAARNSLAQQLGYNGSANDAGFNDFLVANGKGASFEALVRGMASAVATPFRASSAGMAGWEAMSADQRTAVARELGWQGGVDDAAFNAFVVATAQGGRLDALLAARAPAKPTPPPLSPEQQYLAAYPDVAAAGMSAADHYAIHGAREGRNSFGMTLTRDQAYLARYPDVAAAYARGDVSSAASHYQQHGAAEGRAYQRGGVVGASGSATGGVVANGIRGVDSVSAEYAGGGRIWLAGREGILTADATAAIGGEETIAWINRHRALPTVVGAYQSGGVVGDSGWVDAAPKAAATVIDMAPVVTAVGAVRSAVLEIGGQIAAMAARLAGVEDAIDNQSAEIRMLGNRLSKLVIR